MKRILGALLFAAVLGGCTDGGFQRGVFYGKVIDHTPEEVAGTFGKPDAVDNSAPDNLRYIYNRKTFNPDNMNKVDDKTIVEFVKGKDGKVICADVTYM